MQAGRGQKHTQKYTPMYTHFNLIPKFEKLEIVKIPWPEMHDS